VDVRHLFPVIQNAVVRARSAAGFDQSNLTADLTLDIRRFQTQRSFVQPRGV
jgi:hypothetical protein